MDDRTCSALLALAENAGDPDAQAALYNENKPAIEAAIGHWLGVPRHDGAAKTVILRIAKRACYFYPYEDATAWVVNCADLECRRLRDEMERSSRDYRRAPAGFDAGLWSQDSQC